MVKNLGFVNIRVILDRLLRHPLLTDLNLESAILYSLDFIHIMGFPNIYLDKIEHVEIINYRGLLPCDLVSINQVRESKSKRVFISMSDNFNPDCKDYTDRELTFKTLGRAIFTSLKEGCIDISYKALPIDEEGLPLLPDNSIFLKALELYIKKEWFTILFDMGKISPAVLNNTLLSYAFLAGQCNNEFIIPSVTEMETITNMWNQLIPRITEFQKGFKHLGDKEYIKIL